MLLRLFKPRGYAEVQLGNTIHHAFPLLECLRVGSSPASKSPGNSTGAKWYMVSSSGVSRFSRRASISFIGLGSTSSAGSSCGSISCLWRLLRFQSQKPNDAPIKPATAAAMAMPTIAPSEMNLPGSVSNVMSGVDGSMLVDEDVPMLVDVVLVDIAAVDTTLVVPKLVAVVVTCDSTGEFTGAVT